MRTDEDCLAVISFGTRYCHRQQVRVSERDVARRDLVTVEVHFLDINVVVREAGCTDPGEVVGLDMEIVSNSHIVGQLLGRL